MIQAHDSASLYVHSPSSHYLIGRDTQYTLYPGSAQLLSVSLADFLRNKYNHTEAVLRELGNYKIEYSAHCGSFKQEHDVKELLQEARLEALSRLNARSHSGTSRVITQLRLVVFKLPSLVSRGKSWDGF